MTSLLDSALSLAAVGIPVFPLRENKRPVGGKGYLDATDDPGAVARLFADPAAVLIGVPTGAVTGFDVLDIDTARGGQIPDDLPATRRHGTRSGGFHFLFKHIPGLRNSVDRVAPGVDVRSDGGYIVWWPAHGFPITGAGYAKWPTPLLLAAARATRDRSSTPVDLDKLRPPSADALIALIESMPNPAHVTRDDYTSVNMAVQGCLRALEADDAAVDDIQHAAAEWAARWDSASASDVADELAKWESDWSQRTDDISGWPHLLGHAKRFGCDISGWTLAAAVADFAGIPVAEPAAAGNPDWRSLLMHTEGKNPTPLGNLANAIEALRTAPEWFGTLALDTFRNRIVFRRLPPFQQPGEVGRVLIDPDYTQICAWLQIQGVPVAMETTHRAVDMVATEHRFSSLQDDLSALRWDGVPRIDTWLTDHLGVDDTPLHRAFASRWLISAVARAFAPGCKVDTVLILEGTQGKGKSETLRALTGDARFTDHIPDLQSKDAAMQLAGAWVIEHAEMATLRRANMQVAKEFISRREDRYRPPYGRVVQDFPRQSVFAATANPNGSGYLTDETGARRFWPVLCKKEEIDVAGVAKARDQLWAEAVHRYRAGEKWYLDSADLKADQRDATDARYDADVWSDQVAGILRGKSCVTGAEVLLALGIPIKDHNRSHQMRIAGILKVAGWEPKQARRDGQKTRYYFPPEGAEVEQPGESHVADLLK